MKSVIKLEEATMFVASVIALYVYGNPWWVYLLLMIGPDISMFAYFFGPVSGGVFYNIFHHKGIAVVFGLIGILTQSQTFLIIAIILFGHSSLDRMMGYGLKYFDAFKHTHLGWIEKTVLRKTNAS